MKIIIRLLESVKTMLRKIPNREDMSFNNIAVSCINNSLNEMDLDEYNYINIYDDKKCSLFLEFILLYNSTCGELFCPYKFN